MGLDPKLAQRTITWEKFSWGEGNIPRPITEFEEALRLHPDFPEAKNLRRAKPSGGDSLTLSPQLKFHRLPLGESHECCSHPPVAGLRRVTFSQHLEGHRAVATAAAMLKRLTITVAAVISNHRIDRLESVRGADGTVLG